jgi:hypothetical protein
VICKKQKEKITEVWYGNLLKSGQLEAVRSYIVTNLENMDGPIAKEDPAQRNRQNRRQ